MSTELLVYLAAMVVTVPIAKRLGLGAVLGYLIVGVLIGPQGLGWVGGEHDSASHFAEFGVIMMLFLIGLELKPALLWKLRLPIFGWGSAQVLGTVAVVGGVAYALGWSIPPALAVGMIFALSSTAIALQVLEEKSLLKTPGGETAFSVLLFQDLAVIPILAIFPLLGAQTAATSPIAGWWAGLRILFAVASVILVGRFAIRPLYRAVAGAHLRELFTAIALLLVLGVSALMIAVGMSPALGAFLAGVVLADSEYRHQLEIDIAPFKGLLLAMFFMSVGGQIDLRQIGASPVLVLGGVAGMMALKAALLWLIARLARLPGPDRFLFAAALAQGGEFAFVLIQEAQKSGIWESERAGLLRAIIALSMMAAPLLLMAYLRWILPLWRNARSDAAPADVMDEKDTAVIVAGIGRFGQTLVRLLRASGYRVTVLDHDAEQVELIRRFGMKTYYGDALVMDILHAAGAGRARLLILALDDAERMVEAIPEIKKQFPHLKILARAYDRVHAYRLLNLGVDEIAIETSGSALSLGIEALKRLGMPARQAVRSAQIFKQHNDASIRELAQHYGSGDEQLFVSQARSWLQAMETLFQQDAKEDMSQELRSGWESAPRGDKGLS